MKKIMISKISNKSKRIEKKTNDVIVESKRKALVQTLKKLS